MAKKVQYLLDAARPYQIVFCICGIAPFPAVANKSSFHWIFSVLFHIYKAFLIATTLFITYERCKFVSIHSNLNNDYLSNGLQFGQFITLTMIQCMMHLIVFVKYNDLKRIFSEIGTIERDVLHVSSKIHTFCSRFTFKRQLLCVSGLMLLTVLMTPVTNIYTYVLKIFPFLQWCIGIFSEIAIRCKSIEFCVLVQVFNQLLSELLTCINELQRNFNSLGDRYFIERSLLQKRIICIQNLQSKIWKTINGFTDYFSITILCHFVYNGLSITNIVYWEYVKFQEDSCFFNISRMLTLSFLLLDILLPCYLCDICIQTYGKIIRLIHDFKPAHTDILIKMCLREYSLQLTHQKLTFSCGGYFNINLQCFGDIVLAITTYIVILIQFKLQAEKS